MDPKISILLPTRGRTEQLKRSVLSLIDLADQPESIEWLFGFDEDDPESISYWQKNIAPLIDQSQGSYVCIEYEPMGYVRLNEYVNDLASRAHGDWFVFWNDDAIMLDQGWDTEIAKYTGKFCLQAFETHNGHPYSIFPIVPRQWFQILGHLSQHQLNDAWLSQIGWLLDIVIRIPINVEHERYDLTGKNHDATYQQRKVFEGNTADPRDFNHVSNRIKRFGEAARLAQYLKANNYDTSHWQQVNDGKIDPWAKMLAADVNKHLQKYK